MSYRLGLDPSLTCFGWALEVYGKVVSCGAIRTEPGKNKKHLYQADDDQRRAEELMLGLAEVDPGVECEVVSEAPGGSQSARGLAALKFTQGLVIGWARGVNGHLHFVTAMEAKKAATGKKNASKDEVIAAARAAGVPLPSGPKPCIEAAADAWAVLKARPR